eukprot:m.30380 g.30380  ORF g.30380 m.30380 type:complete len:826 (-) comp16275_c0_seq1:162-2639(-)
MEKMKQEVADRKRARTDEPASSAQMMHPKKKFLEATTKAAAPHTVPPGPCPQPTDPIPIKILKHSNRHLAEKLNQRYEELEIKEKTIQEAEKTRAEQQNLLRLLAQQWDQMDRDVTSLLRGETTAEFANNPDPIYPDLAKTPQPLSEAEAVLQRRSNRTKAIVKHLTDVVERVHRESAQAAAAAESDVVKQLSIRLQASHVECKALQTSVAPLRAQNDELQETLSIAHENLEQGKAQMYELEHRLERVTNHNTNLKLQIEEVKVSAAAAVVAGKALLPASNNGSTGGNTNSAELVLRAELDMKLKEITELKLLLEQSRKNEAHLKGSAITIHTDQIKSSAEYKNAVALHKAERKLLSEEKAQVRLNAENLWNQMHSERAAADAMRTVEEERRIQTHKIVTELMDQVTQLSLERDTLIQTIKIKDQTSKSKRHEQELQSLVDRLQKDQKDARTEITRLRRVIQERALKSALLWEDEGDEKVKAMQDETNRALENEKNLKLLLNVYQNVDKDKREKVNICYSQQKAKDELLDLKKKLATGEVGTENESKAQLVKVTKKMKDFEATLIEKKAQEQVLMQELESTGNSLDEYEEKIARLMADLKQKEEATFELMAAKIQADARGKLALQHPSQALEKCKALEAEMTKKDSLIKSLRDNDKALKDNHRSTEKRLRETETQLDAVQQELTQKNAYYGGIKLELQDSTSHFEKLKQQLVDSAQITTELESTLREKEQDVQRVRSDVSRLNSAIGSGGADNMYKSTVISLTKKLNCTICTKRPKNAFINQCMHVFCYECLIGLIDGRSRKCPKCLQKFGKDDVKKLYMDMDDT